MLVKGKDVEVITYNKEFVDVRLYSSRSLTIRVPRGTAANVATVLSEKFEKNHYRFTDIRDYEVAK